MLNKHFWVWGISPSCVSPIFLKACGVLKNVAFRQIAFRQVAFRQIENY